jgi:hypothetical protein
MGELAKATSVDQLKRINELIHDRWFDVEDVTFDAHNRVLAVRFRDRPDEELLAPKSGSAYELRMHHVEKYQVEDSQQIGRYDFNVIRYDAAERKITVVTGIPCTFWAVVRKLEVRVVPD